jgi:hypothetical protein
VHLWLQLRQPRCVKALEIEGGIVVLFTLKSPSEEGLIAEITLKMLQ